MPVPSIARTPLFWLVAFIAWFVALWILSSHSAPDAPGTSHGDKVLHFGYFFGGAGLLSAALFLFRYKPEAPFRWPALFVLVTLALAAVGALDEWHQSWVPERTGNDPGDWLADILGALAGTLVFRKFHRLLLPRAVAGDQ